MATALREMCESLVQKKPFKANSIFSNGDHIRCQIRIDFANLKALGAGCATCNWRVICLVFLGQEVA